MHSNTWTGKRHTVRRLALLLAIPLLAAPAVAQLPQPAFAAEQAAAEQSAVSVCGADALAWGDSFECATVTGLGSGTLYADVSIDGKVVTKDMKYKYDDASDTFGVVQLNASADQVRKYSGKMQLDFYTAKTADRDEDASPLLSAKVYAVCADAGSDSSATGTMVGIRVAREGEATSPFAAPQTIIRGESTSFEWDGNEPTLKDGVLYVGYAKPEDAATSIQGAVIYVDEQGIEIKRVSEQIESGKQKVVPLLTTFESNGKTYTVKAKASQVTLTAQSPVQRVYCMAQKEADKTTKDVTINYVSATTGKTLVVDHVTVGAGGYKYAPATAFSQAHDLDVMRYTLAGATDSAGNTYTAAEAKTLSLTRGGAQTYTLTYEPEETELTYTVNFALVSAGKNGNTDVAVTKSATAKVSASTDATVELPATIEKDGTTYKRSGSDTSLTYTWADLSAGRALSDTVYYVSSDVTTPEAYDVTVRYVDAVSGTELGTKTLTCKPDGSALSITSPESVTYKGTEYARLSGQSAAITHRFYAPYRTYTVYYAVPGSMAEGDTTVTRTVVVDGGIRYYTIRADGTVSTAANGTTGLVATTPYTAISTQTTTGTTDSADGSTATDSGSDQTSDATAPSGDTAYEERIADDETPLSSGKETNSNRPALIAAGVTAVAVILALLLFLWRRKRNGNDGLDNVKGA